MAVLFLVLPNAGGGRSGAVDYKSAVVRLAFINVCMDVAYGEAMREMAGLALCPVGPYIPTALRGALVCADEL